MKIKRTAKTEDEDDSDQEYWGETAAIWTWISTPIPVPDDEPEVKTRLEVRP